MKVVFHEDFYQVYTSDPAAAPGRMEAVVETIEPYVTFVHAEPASREDIAAVHSDRHIQGVENHGLYDIAALAAGGAVQSAQIGLSEPCFGLIRPPGHHASSDSAWGFCYFSNMSIALETLHRKKQISSACVLDMICISATARSIFWATGIGWPSSILTAAAEADIYRKWKRN